MSDAGNLPCTVCGAIEGIEEYDQHLWSIYNRLKSGKSHYEALVFDSQWCAENIQDEDDHEAMMGAMGRDMHNRGLCTKCGRPDLRGVTENDIYSEQDAKDMADMYAEQAAERRAGC